MKRPTQLTHDAREVLLVAQLPDENNERGFIREHGDVRRAQLVKGWTRLEEIGLVQKDTPLLTAEGVKLASRLQENNAKLLAGIPFAERAAAIKLRGGKETANVADEWFTTEIDGRTATTNAHLIIFGKPPSENKLIKPQVKAENVIKLWIELAEGEPVKVRPIAYSEIQGWKYRVRLVWFSDGSVLNAEIYQFIIERYELLSWTHRQERDDRGKGFKYALNAYFKGERVAAAMTYSAEAGDVVKQLIAAADKPADTEVVKSVEPKPEPVVLRPFDASRAVQLSFLEQAA